MTPARRYIDTSTLSRKFAHLKRFILEKSLQHVDQMPFFENTTILCRDPYDFSNYSKMKIEVASMLNLERPITATPIASSLLEFKKKRGGGERRCHNDLCSVKSVRYQINILYYFRNSENWPDMFLKSYNIYLMANRFSLRPTSHRRLLLCKLQR